jgi:hypothetical protein
MDFTFLRDISIIIAIWVAIYGIDSWRREYRGKRQIELAEETLSLFYEVSDAIAHIRNPFGFSNEYESIERAENETDAKFNSRKQASIVFYRYKQHNELFSHLHSMRYRFMANFGKEKAASFDDIHKVVHEIILAARMLSTMWAREYYPDEKSHEQHRQLVAKHESVFWFQGEGDEIVSRVNAIVENIETTCREIIMGKGTIHYFLNWKWRKNG